MHYITTIFLAAMALTSSLGVQAQSTISSDMSRYESIYETPKGPHGKTASQSVPKGIQPGKHVETIGPSVGYATSRVNAPGAAETRQPIARGGIVMKADGAADAMRAPAQSGTPSPDSRTR